MNTQSRSFKIFVGIVTCVAIVGLAIALWTASIVEHLSSASSKQSFVVDCDFDRFRQIMVRKNATEAIIGHSGMKLVSEKVENVELDTTHDDRPLLNAIRGKSKSELSAIKTITVELDDPTLEASELVLRQVAEVKPTEINVTTRATEPSGRLENYVTMLYALPNTNGTEVTITLEMSVRVRVPKLFVGRADAGVQKAADDAISGQAAAIKQFIIDNADQRLIVPNL